MSEICTRVELIDLTTGATPASFEVGGKLSVEETEKAIMLLSSAVALATRPDEQSGEYSYRALCKF